MLGFRKLCMFLPPIFFNFLFFFETLMFRFRQIVRGRNPCSGFFSGEVCRLGASARSPVTVGMIAGTDVPGHVARNCCQDDKCQATWQLCDFWEFRTS